MQFRNQDEPMAPAYFRNVSGLLLAFVVLSALVHGASLLLSPETIVPFDERRFGATIISTVLAPAKDKPATRPSHNTAPLAQANNSATKVPKLIQATKAIEPSRIPDTSVMNKTDVKINVKKDSNVNLETKLSQTQSESKTSPQAKLVTKTTTRENDTPSTTESIAHQLEIQRNYLLGEVQNRLNRYLVYPIRARKRGWQGEVMVAFHINELGQLNNVRLAQSSGYSLLDHSAVDAIRKLKNVSLPNTLGHLQAMELQLPVRYQLQES